MDARTEIEKEKDKTAFRNYVDKPGVKRTYRLMHQNQNCFFAKIMRSTYGRGIGIKMSFKDAFDVLNHVIDESDPDVDFPQIYHAYQTGEALKMVLSSDNSSHLKSTIRIRTLFSDKEWEGLPKARRESYPEYIHTLYPEITDWSWLPLIGFLHDVGKVLATEKWGSVPQWAVVGDTFPVGAPFSQSNVYAEKKYYADNLDLNIEKSENDKCGMYQRHCGFGNVCMSWGHDEYGYTVLNNTVNKLPDEALYIVRFHSFYSWHTPRNEIRAYEDLANDDDWRMLPLLKMFQQSDLYSKGAKLPDIQALQAEYLTALEKFFPGRVEQVNDIRSPEPRW